MKIADKYQFTKLFDTCDSLLAQLCAHKLGSGMSKTKLKPYIKRAIEGANMVRAPKWTTAIFKKRIEDAKVSINTISNEESDMEEVWSSLINKNPDFAMLAAKTTRKDFHSWLDQHKSWTFVPYVKEKEKSNDLVFIYRWTSRRNEGSYTMS